MERRLGQNPIVRRSARTRSATSPAASPWVEARVPGSSSSTGGFQMATTRSPDGEPSSVTAVTSTPVSADASAAGAPMVAEEQMNTGSAP